MLLSTKGAANRLGCSVDWVRKLASKGKLKAYIYVDGAPAEYVPDSGARQGQGLYFQEQDLDAYKPANRGRSMGSKDKAEDNPKRKREKKPDITEVLDSLHSAMVTWPGSWSEDHRLAWLYGIIVGWEDEEEICKKFHWDEETCNRFKQYRQVIGQLTKERA